MEFSFHAAIERELHEVMYENLVSNLIISGVFGALHQIWYSCRKNIWELHERVINNSDVEIVFLTIGISF